MKRLAPAAICLGLLFIHTVDAQEPPAAILLAGNALLTKLQNVGTTLIGNGSIAAVV